MEWRHAGFWVLVGSSCSCIIRLPSRPFPFFCWEARTTAKENGCPINHQPPPPPVVGSVCMSV